MVSLCSTLQTNRKSISWQNEIIHFGCFGIVTTEVIRPVFGHKDVEIADEEDDSILLKSSFISLKISYNYSMQIRITSTGSNKQSKTISSLSILDRDGKLVKVI